MSGCILLRDLGLFAAHIVGVAGRIVNKRGAVHVHVITSFLGYIIKLVPIIIIIVFIIYLKSLAYLNSFFCFDSQSHCHCQCCLASKDHSGIANYLDLSLNGSLQAIYLGYSGFAYRPAFRWGMLVSDQMWLLQQMRHSA